MKIGKLEPTKLQGYKIAEKEGRKFIFAWLDETRGFYSDPEKEYNGNKGSGRFYQDMVMIETPNSEYSDYMVKESLSKEDRENGVELEPIGNFKNYRKPDSSGQTVAEAPKDDNDGSDPLPF